MASNTELKRTIAKNKLYIASLQEKAKLSNDQAEVRDIHAEVERIERENLATYIRLQKQKQERRDGKDSL